MGLYTANNEVWIDQQIHSQLKLVTDAILKKVSDVSSIMLTGGFGRGEGSVIIRNGKIIVLRDFDIVLLMQRKMPSSSLHQLIEEVNDILCHESSSKIRFERLSFSVSILQFTLDEILHFPDIKTYDLKARSIILYGQDIRDRINFESIDIPPICIARIFFHNMMGLMEFFSPKFLDSVPHEFNKLNLVLECAKTYLNIGSLLTLMIGEYKPTYAERSEVIKNKHETISQFLGQKIPDLSNKITFFTDLKLHPNEKIIDNIDAIDLWFDARENLRVVFEYYINHYFQVPNTSNLIESCKKWYGHMTENGLDPYISSYVRTTLGIDIKFLTRFLGYFYRRYSAFSFLKGSHKLQKSFRLSLLKEFPLFKIYCSMPLLLYSLDRNGNLDKKLFDAFIKAINMLIIFKVNSSRSDGKWAESVKCLKSLKEIMYISFE